MTDSLEQWLKEQKREDVIEEIIYNCKKTDLKDLKKIGWTNGFPERFRCPSWQLLLHYLPQSKSKRKSTLRRKRIEYHRYITKHYFEFDFCLTDRKLASPGTCTKPKPKPKPKQQIPTNDDNESISSAQLSPTVKQRLSVTSQLQKLQSDELFEASLMPLFSQPSSTSTEKKSTTREDSLLIQIRHDINKMVKIPTSSSSSSSALNRHVSKLSLFKRSISKNDRSNSNRTKTKSKHGSTLSPYDDNIHGDSTTTTNRLFANPLVKSSLERILYLWSIRVKKDDKKKENNDGNLRSDDVVMFSNTSSTSRYIPGMVDLVYPLYLIILHGYVWDTHISTTLDSDSDDCEANDDAIGKNNVMTDDDHFLMKLGMKDEVLDNDKDNVELSEIDEKSNLYQSEVLEKEARESKLQFCQELSKGIGIDRIPEEIMDEIECDTFWCLEHMMNAIQDFRYNDAFFPKSTSTSTSASSKKFKLSEGDGLQRMIVLTEKVLQRVDPKLHSHLKSKGVEFQWFCFRWMNTLHVRTMNEECIIRFWDTCLCEEIDTGSRSRSGLHYFTAFGFDSRRSRKRLHLSGFLSFQVYICAALLHQIRDNILKEQEFENILYKLRNLSLDHWDIEDIAMLLSQAYSWKETFGASEDQLFASATTAYGDDTLSTWVEKCHWPPRKEAATRPSDSVEEAIAKILHSEIKPV